MQQRDPASEQPFWGKVFEIWKEEEITEHVLSASRQGLFSSQLISVEFESHSEFSHNTEGLCSGQHKKTHCKQAVRLELQTRIPGHL